MSKLQYEKARIYKTKMPYHPINHAPFGITSWAKLGKLHIRVYQGVSGDLIQIDVSEE